MSCLPFKEREGTLGGTGGRPAEVGVSVCGREGVGLLFNEVGDVFSTFKETRLLLSCFVEERECA